MQALSIITFSIMLLVAILYVNKSFVHLGLGQTASMALLIISIVAFVVSYIYDHFRTKKENNG